MNDANKENCPPVPHKEQTVDTVKINEIIARCVVPTDEHIRIAGRRIVEESAKELQSARVSGMWDEYCPAPNFGLILDELEPCLEEGNNDSIHLHSVLDVQAENVATTSTTKIINLEDDEWDAEEVEAACVEAERRSKADGALSPINFNTPERVVTKTDDGSGGKFSSSSSSGELITNKYERRLIKPSASLRSPFLDLDTKKEFYCKPEVNRLYALVILHARICVEQSPDVDIGPNVIDFNGYFVTVRELAESMKRDGFVLSHVFEVGLQSVIQNLPPDSRKVIMPLRFSVRLQQMDWNTQEITAKFKKSNHLDRKDMIMFPILENLDPTKPKTGNHYWVFNLNIRDKRFEVLDSWRTLDDCVLNKKARLIAATVRCLWDHHYGNSNVVLDDYPLVNIDVPRQNNDIDCGIYGLTNTRKWVARAVPTYEPSDIPNIRKQLTSTWVSSTHNKAPWKDILELP